MMRVAQLISVFAELKHFTVVLLRPHMVTVGGGAEVGT